MKKIFNTIFVCGFLAAVCAMCSSCLILVDDEALGGCGITVETTTTPAYSTIKVNNICTKYGTEAAYISKVYYKTYSSDEWQLAWDSHNSDNPLYADCNCQFYLEPGRYYFCARVIYPNMSKVYDYYDDYYTDYRYACTAGSTITFEFDGDDPYRK